MVSAELEAKTFEALGALISNIKRADGKNWRDAFENGPAYLQVRHDCAERHLSMLCVHVSQQMPRARRLDFPCKCSLQGGTYKPPQSPARRVRMHS